ncbi:hypothetical protein A2U01_0048821, partial [Trifolium medium]|nr:hypothetical protein [Trifolium medium]
EVLASPMDSTSLERITLVKEWKFGDGLKMAEWFTARGEKDE